MRAGCALLVLSIAVLSSGCPSRDSLGVGAMSIVGEGVINDPKNKSLRFDLLKFGLDEFCKEMQRRGAPLKIRDDEPVLGRFFAEQCGSQIIDDDEKKSFVVQYQGRGYAWTNVTERIGFSTAGLIEYAPDFKLHDGAMYVYFRPLNVDAAAFKTLMMESNLARTGAAMTGVNPDEVGRRIVDSQLNRGFTVIRYSDTGETEFGMGYTPIGQRPFHPFKVVQSEKLTLDNDRTEVHSGQQDFIGGFEVTDDDQAFYLTVKVDGAPAVDLFVVSKAAGDQLISGYVERPGGSVLNAPPLLDEPVPAGQLWKRYVPVPKGLYYLMIDHTGAVGRTAPPSVAGDDRAAKVDYIVQLGPKP
jgi:hypothetical protein